MRGLDKLKVKKAILWVNAHSVNTNNTGKQKTVRPLQKQYIRRPLKTQAN